MAQLDTAKRMDLVVAEAGNKLMLLNARLGEAVARAIELSASKADVTATGGLRDDVDAMVGDMEALRLALDEADAASGQQLA